MACDWTTDVSWTVDIYLKCSNYFSSCLKIKIHDRAPTFNLGVSQEFQRLLQEFFAVKRYTDRRGFSWSPWSWVLWACTRRATAPGREGCCTKATLSHGNSCRRNSPSPWFLSPEKEIIYFSFIFFITKSRNQWRTLLLTGIIKIAVDVNSFLQNTDSRKRPICLGYNSSHSAEVMFTSMWQVFTSIPYNCFMICTPYSVSINGLMVVPGVNTSPTFLVHNMLAL